MSCSILSSCTSESTGVDCSSQCHVMATKGSRVWMLWAVLASVFAKLSQNSKVGTTSEMLKFLIRQKVDIWPLFLFYALHLFFKLRNNEFQARSLGRIFAIISWIMGSWPCLWRDMYLFPTNPLRLPPLNEHTSGQRGWKSSSSV